MNNQYYIIDAFAEKPYSGVPVAVFPHAESIDDKQADMLAGEMLASDVVFARATPAGSFRLQTFHEGRAATTGSHAMLAAASGLLKTGRVALNDNKADFSFLLADGEAEVNVNFQREHYPLLISQKITPSIDRYTPSAEEIAATIGLAASDIASSRYSCLIVSCGKPYLFVPLKSYHALREASFHNREWSHSSMPQSLVDSILLFAPNTDNKGGDFHARLLERVSGASADPAIGEAMPAFAAYLCQQRSVQQGTHAFSVRRGANNARQSLIHLEMDNLGTESIPVRIGGATAITSMAELVAAS